MPVSNMFLESIFLTSSVFTIRTSVGLLSAVHHVVLSELGLVIEILIADGTLVNGTWHQVQFFKRNGDSCWNIIHVKIGGICQERRFGKTLARNLRGAVRRKNV